MKKTRDCYYISRLRKMITIDNMYCIGLIHHLTRRLRRLVLGAFSSLCNSVPQPP